MSASILNDERECWKCGCTHTTPCWDKRLMSPCAWAEPDLCTACLTDAQFLQFMETKPRLVTFTFAHKNKQQRRTA